MSGISILWFRRDLRLGDNPALHHAASCGQVLPVYIHKPEPAEGAASQAWLHYSLAALNRSLNGRLCFYHGDAAPILTGLAQTTGARSVCWNRCWEPQQDRQDELIREQLQQLGVQVEIGNASLLWEPPGVLKKDGTPYRVFTPYFRKGCLASTVREPLGDTDFTLTQPPEEALQLDALDLLPAHDWHRKVLHHWQPGEEGARQQLSRFLDSGLRGYREGRDRPALPHVSRLSPHLHFGEVSPHTLWHSASAAGLAQGLENDLDCFLAELGWREFSRYLLHHWPHLPERNLNPRFDRFPWLNEAGDALRAWQHGQTGIPVVDAGMRELWQTGYMHNRVRMVTASFLVKNLLLHWKLGAQWFEDSLLDADLANNRASWQWVAGCGADAAPYFRIFNPVTQGRRFDTDGQYVRAFVPEIADLPDKYLHAPWEAPAELLQDCGITLGKDYPQPIVDLKASRQRALDAFASLKSE